MKIKALSKLKPEEGIWMTEVDKPELGHNDLLIGVPDYNGHSATNLTTLPVYHVLTRPTDWADHRRTSVVSMVRTGGKA